MDAQEICLNKNNLESTPFNGETFPMTRIYFKGKSALTILINVC